MPCCRLLKTAAVANVEEEGVEAVVAEAKSSWGGDPHVFPPTGGWDAIIEVDQHKQCPRSCTKRIIYIKVS